MLKMLCLIIVAGCSDGPPTPAQPAPNVQTVDGETERQELKSFATRLVQAVVEKDGRWDELIG